MSSGNTNGRRGFAFLMLVFMLLVIVMGCVQMMIQQEVSDRRSIRHNHRAEILSSAIEVAVELDSVQAVTLPISDDPEQKVVVSFDETAESWVATWLKDNNKIDSVTRKKTK